MLAALLATSALLAQPFPQTIPVPPGSQPEGVAAGPGRIGYVGSRADGSVYRFNVRTGEGRVLVSGREGRGAYGLKRFGRRLYVAGGPTGFLYVYNARTGRPVDAVDVDGTFVNDVTVTRAGGVLHRLAEGRALRLPARRRRPGRAQPHRRLGAAGGLQRQRHRLDPNGRRLVIVQSNTGKLFTANPRTGATNEIDLGGENVQNGDGLVLEGRRLYVVRNQNNEIAVVRLNRAMTSGRIVRRLKDDGLRHADHRRAHRRPPLRGQRALLGRGAGRGDDLRRGARGVAWVTPASRAAPPSGSAHAGWRAGACAARRTRGPRPSWSRCPAAGRSPCRDSPGRCGAAPRARGR